MLDHNRDRWCLQATSGFRKPLNYDWLNFILRKMAITWHSFETLSRPSRPSHHGKCESLHCPRMPHTRSSQWPLRSCSPWLAAGSVVNASSTISTSTWPSRGAADFFCGIVTRQITSTRWTRWLHDIHNAKPFNPTKEVKCPIVE